MSHVTELYGAIRKLDTWEQLMNALTGSCLYVSGQQKHDKKDGKYFQQCLVASQRTLFTMWTKRL